MPAIKEINAIDMASRQCTDRTTYKPDSRTTQGDLLWRISFAVVVVEKGMKLVGPRGAVLYVQA
jgi:hypothetical protein